MLRGLLSNRGVGYYLRELPARQCFSRALFGVGFLPRASIELSVGSVLLSFWFVYGGCCKASSSCLLRSRELREVRIGLFGDASIDF